MLCKYHSMLTMNHCPNNIPTSTSIFPFSNENSDKGQLYKSCTYVTHKLFFNYKELFAATNLFRSVFRSTVLYNEIGDIYYVIIGKGDRIASQWVNANDLTLARFFKNLEKSKTYIIMKIDGNRRIHYSHLALITNVVSCAQSLFHFINDALPLSSLFPGFFL